MWQVYSQHEHILCFHLLIIRTILIENNLVDEVYSTGRKRFRGACAFRCFLSLVLNEFWIFCVNDCATRGKKVNMHTRPREPVYIYLGFSYTCYSLWCVWMMAMMIFIINISDQLVLLMGNHKEKDVIFPSPRCDTNNSKG